MTVFVLSLLFIYTVQGTPRHRRYSHLFMVASALMSFCVVLRVGANNINMLRLDSGRGTRTVGSSGPVDT